MKRKIFISLAALLALCASIGFTAPQYAFAASGTGSATGSGTANTAQTDICAGVDAVQKQANGTSACSTNGTSTVGGIIHTVINVMSFFVGLVAVVMIIVGGFRYITSGGDSGKASSARTTIVSAVIGLLIVALAQVIVQFVLTNGNPAGSSTTQKKQ